jgi:N-acetylmuramoyl-L-alanine amidase
MTADYGVGAAIEAGVNIEQEVKKPVLVIDAGHGGFDGGAESADGTQEKNINLAIALALKDEASQYPVEIVMTREADQGLDGDGDGVSKKREDLLERKKIMEEASANLAVSIHLNSYPSDASVYGAQVFYPSADGERTEGRTDEQGAGYSSRDFAESVQKSLETAIPDGREREAMKKNDILLFQNPTCPIVLVECGFLSNQKEADNLKTPEYQQELAKAIWQGINEILCLEKDENLPVIDSTNKSK